MSAPPRARIMFHYDNNTDIAGLAAPTGLTPP